MYALALAGVDAMIFCEDCTAIEEYAKAFDEPVDFCYNFHQASFAATEATASVLRRVQECDPNYFGGNKIKQ